MIDFVEATCYCWRSVRYSLIVVEAEAVLESLQRVKINTVLRSSLNG